MSKNMSEEIKEAILEATETGYDSTKADRLIQEFTQKLIHEQNLSEAFEWIKGRVHDLMVSGTREDVREAISTNYFRLGFGVGILLTIGLFCRPFEIYDF